MNSRTGPSRATAADFLLSWDRLGFRLVIFGGLALLWILQGRVLNVAWSKLIWSELAGTLPWAFLAPIVIYVSRRIQISRLDLGRFLAFHVLGMVLVFIPFWLIQRGVYLLWDGSIVGWNPSLFSVFIPTKQNVLSVSLSAPVYYILILLGAEAMKHARARQEEKLQAGRLAGQLAEARLALLQRQLHPHFLFNALQAISTLLHRDPKTADGLVVRLSTLLRGMLENASGQTLGLRTELDLTRKYLEIEQVRFADRLSVEWAVDASLLEFEVPSLVLLPLVENAIRHGLSPKVGPGLLKISASTDETSLQLTVEDDGRGTTLPLGPGVGIGNTRERLETIYGGRASLEIETRPEEGFRARIRIPLPESQP